MEVCSLPLQNQLLCLLYTEQDYWAYDVAVGSVSVIQSKITGHMMYSSGSVSVIQSKITGHMM